MVALALTLWVVSGTPSTNTRPPSLVSSPATIETAVVLPAPFGPTACRSPTVRCDVDAVDRDQVADCLPQPGRFQHVPARVGAPVGSGGRAHAQYRVMPSPGASPAVSLRAL